MARDLESRLEEMRRGLARLEVTADVPEWASFLGEDRVFVRELSGSERDWWEDERVRISFGPDGKVQRTVNLANLRARLVAKVLAYEDGAPVFRDAAKLGACVGGQILDRLFVKALEVSGLAEREAVRERPFASSSTDSPAASAGAASNGALSGSAAGS